MIKLSHEALTKTHNLRLAFAFGIEIRSSLPSSYWQICRETLSVKSKKHLDKFTQLQKQDCLNKYTGAEL